MRWAVLDTSIYVGHWQADAHGALLEDVRRAFVVRHSAVVLSELRRGARTPEAQRLVAQLHRLARIVWAPTTKDWWQAGEIIRGIGDARDWEASKRREFQNDTLIALTARHNGATVVTTNRNDFELLEERLRVSVIYA